jgi:hypothetical protein
MQYRKSHNSYLQNKKEWIINDIKHGCNIIEADIIRIRDGVMIAHGWRPFKWFCHGKLLDYMEKIQYYCKDKKMYFSIELKEKDEILYRKLINILCHIKLPETIKILIDGDVEIIDDFFKYYKKWGCGLDLQNWRVWESDKQIENVDCWGHTLINRILNEV